MKKLFRLMLSMILVIGMVSPVYASDYNEYPEGMTGEQYQQYLLNIINDKEGEEVLEEEYTEEPAYVVEYDMLQLKKITINKKGEGTQLTLYDKNRHLTLVFDFTLTVKAVKQLKGKGVCFDYAYKEDFLLIHIGADLEEGIIYSDQDDINDLAE